MTERAEKLLPEGTPRPEAVEAILDVLLLALIRGNPYEDKTLKNEGTRLRTVKKALLGMPSSRGNPADSDIPELLYMARAYVAERGKPEYDSNYELIWQGDTDQFSFETQLAIAAVAARKATDPLHTYHNEQEKIRNLQQKFHRNIQDWLKIVHGQDGLAEDVFTLKLRELEELFAPLGIRIEIPIDPLRDPNYPI